MDIPFGSRDCELAPGPLTVRDIRILKGANYFSGGPVVIFRLDLGDYDEVFTNEIPGFFQKLSARLPSLEEHHCSVGKPGGFFVRVKEGTLLGHVTEHVAIELQDLAGMDAGYGKTRSTTEQGVYNVVFRYLDEAAGVYAGKSAVNLVNAILQDGGFDVAETIRNLVEIREDRLLGPSTQAIVDEAGRRRIPALRLDEYNLVQLGTGRHRKRIRATLTSDTSMIAVEAADDKFLSLRMLADAGIPVPETERAATAEEALAARSRIGAPVTVKPSRGHLGNGVTVGAGTPEEVEGAFAAARAVDETVLVQSCVPGNTYRLLVIDYAFVAAARLLPPSVTGDGTSTVARLIGSLNEDPRRGIGDKELLTRVEDDEQTVRLLASKGLDLGSVLPEGDRCVLKVTGSLRLGGSAEDVTGAVHPVNRFLAERAARAVGLNVAGIDIIAEDIGRSILETEGRAVEVNAAPDFRMHLRPTEGKRRPAPERLVEMLFPPGSEARVPLFSVTGTLGKTTTVNLLAHCLKGAGFTPGMTSTEGLFIDGTRIMEGDMTFPEQVGLVLKDPTIDCAVLETSREGILRRGLGYEYADVGIVLNMHDDHVGRDDIKYLEDLAYAKSVVAEQVYDDGHAVLNADHELVIEMAGRVGSRLVLFSRKDDDETIRRHVRRGGTAVALDREEIVVLTPRDRILFADIRKIPLLFGGRAPFNLDAVLAAAAALFVQDIPLETIERGLLTFHPSPDMLPGRMNLIDVGGFQVLLDYAHNAVGFQALRDFLASDERTKLGVIDAAGDRSDEEIRMLGKLAAETYDELFLYEGFDRRGRKSGEVLNLLAEGALEAGFPEGRLSRFDDPQAAWQAALGKGRPDLLVVLLSPRSRRTLEIIETSCLPSS